MQATSAESIAVFTPTEPYSKAPVAIKFMSPINYLPSVQVRSFLRSVTKGSFSPIRANGICRLRWSRSRHSALLLRRSVCNASHSRMCGSCFVRNLLRAVRRAGRTIAEAPFEQCHGCTLFLDEIGDMPLALQAKMLRLRQEQAFERVGGNEAIHTDVRVIAATHRDLKSWFAEGKFRSDLFYRLGVFTIHLPPLHERTDDLPLVDVTETLSRL
jgi:transcriptional regulator of acetoin/glycerol metabolism